MKNKRIEKLRAKNKELNRKRKEYSVTDEEHIILTAKLIEIRKPN